MPSFTHEVLLEIFRRRPSLASELLRDVLHVALPRLDHVQLGDTSVNEIVPTERKADLVLLLSDSPGGPPRRALVIEVQLAIDRDKQRSWWWYLVGMHSRHGCEAILVIVAPSDEVAAWAAGPFELGHPGVSLRPIVIGPATVPLVRDEVEATRAPELAVLSVMMHGESKSAEVIGRAALMALRGLDEERAALYTDVVFLSLHAAARAILEDLMANGTYQYQSDFAKRYVAQGEAHGRAEGRAEGEAKGKAEGEAKGKAEGEAKGKAEGRAQAILAVLEARGIEVPELVRHRVLGCTDVSILDVWIARAVTAKAATEVIGE